jgi:hypothetical protein
LFEEKNFDELKRTSNLDKRLNRYIVKPSNQKKYESSSMTEIDTGLLKDRRLEKLNKFAKYENSMLIEMIILSYKSYD